MDHGGHNMDMTMTSTAAMASSTSAMDMAGHDHMTMSMVDMAMTFFTSSRTPLFSDDWTPKGPGQYAGACIFIITLAVILRVLLAMRPILEARIWSRTAAAASAASLKGSEVLDEEGRLMDGQLGPAPAVVGRDARRRWSGWRVGTAASRATCELAIAGVGYLLMLAVMTMNIGYFLSVLGGIWVGTFLLGGLSYDDRSSHC